METYSIHVYEGKRQRECGKCVHKRGNDRKSSDAQCIYCDCDCSTTLADYVCSTSLPHSLPIYENCILTIAHCNRPANVVPNPSTFFFCFILSVCLFIFLHFFFLETFPSICSTSIHIQCVTFDFFLPIVRFFFSSYFYPYLFFMRSIYFLVHCMWIKGNILFCQSYTKCYIDVICIIAWVSHSEIENHS